MPAPDVLFLGHGAERTGPPVLLANFQRWLTAHTAVRFATVVTRGGPLLAEYRRGGPTRVLDPGWTPTRVAQQALARAGRPGAAASLRALRDRGRLGRWAHAPLVYVNTASPATLRPLAHVADDAAVVAHVHELEVALRYQLDDAERALLRERPEQFVAASHAVADNLVDRHGVDPSRVAVHHEFVEPLDPATGTEREHLRRARGLEAGTFVVVGSGMTEWRKGPDLFVALAAELRRRTDRPLALLWVGGATEGPTWWPLDHEARHRGVADVVRFLGAQDHPGPWFRLADAFALTSREDAFPLAALEAASAGTPLVTFDTGGMVELVATAGAGAVVPYPDVGAMAGVLGDWAQDEDERGRAGSVLAAHVRAHHVTDVAAPALHRRISAFLDP